ncbi:DUF5703 family protein [Actinopolyspora mortivallis]|uniref:Dihydroorotate dehydrogenase n=1 Tax=Actinopolyspora mortivallis TaxID=33906 RepID=A0A2T0GVC2_ACTMO|nr:DUF5703 family protein [Actinopolyspora mortivallis]PRW63052.1 hypothetical protein CEP50_12175 [Actinopolyspora mortivallis]
MTPTEDTFSADPDWEYFPLRLPPGISRLSAATRLSIHAEFAGWELSRVLLYSDGSRKVWLRRKRTHLTTEVVGALPTS